TLQLAAQGVLDADRAVVLASDLSDLGAGAGEADIGDGAGEDGAGEDGAGGDESDTQSTVVSSTPAPDSPPASLVVGPSTTWVATDTFDRRAYQFGLVHSSASYLLGPTETVAGSDGPIGQWTDRPIGGHQTVAGYVDGMSVTASSY
nr:hypothetical protein [Micromonospora sp. DSM 115978]